MPVFAWSGRSADGRLLRAEAEAPSPVAVASQLQEAGITPVRIDPAPARDPLGALRSRLSTRAVPLESLIALCRQLHRLSRAGIPILGALGGLAEASRDPALAAALHDVADSIRAGHELSWAFQRHPRVFPSLFVSIVQVGENTGRLEEAFGRLAGYFELELATRRRLRSATRYPAIVLAAVVAALVLVNVFVIPAFARVFESFQAELPWPTRLLIAVSDTTLRTWPLVLAVLAAGVVAARLALRTEGARLALDRARLRVPVVGRITRLAILGRYARSFAMSDAAGLPVLHTLAISARAVGNRFVEACLLEMRRHIERGETFARAAAASALFSPLVLQMLRVGEEAGSIGEMHEQVAETCEAEVDYELRRLVDTLEPILVVAVGGVVLLLALGVYLPMWDLARAARGG